MSVSAPAASSQRMIHRASKQNLSQFQALCASSSLKMAMVVLYQTGVTARRSCCCVREGRVWRNSAVSERKGETGSKENPTFAYLA